MFSSTLEIMHTFKYALQMQENLSGYDVIHQVASVNSFRASNFEAPDKSMFIPRKRHYVMAMDFTMSKISLEACGLRVQV